MENSGNSSAGTNDTVQTFNPTAVQETYYTSVFSENISSNDFCGSYTKASIENIACGSDNYPQQQHFTSVLPDSQGPPVMPPKPALRPNLINCSSPAVQLSAPPAPHTPHHPNQMYTPSRAGSLSLESQQSLDQYLTTPQSHLLQLHGTNPSSLPSQSDKFCNYGTANTPQRFPNFHEYMFSTDQSMKQSNVREILDEESSPSFREASHINRKKRKACGRCGPCRRKDNCGTCMNCINRAKGKQICIFRKCEELKKKPGTETCLPVTSDHQIESPSVIQEKRKELEQLFADAKRSRTEDPNVVLQQGAQLRNKFPALATINQSYPQPHGVVRLASNPRPFYNPLPIQGSGGTFQHQVQRINKNLLADAETINQSSGTPGNTHTSDIVSESLHEIDYSTVETNELKAVLHQSIPTNIPQQQQNFPQSWSHNVQAVNPALNTDSQGILLPGQPPPGPGPGEIPLPQDTTPQQFSSITQPSTTSQTLPDQLLSNLTKFNELGSFQGNNSSQNQGNINNKRPPSVSRANYVDTTNPLLFTPTDTDYDSVKGVSSTSVSISNQSSLFCQDSSTSTSSNMYHNVCSRNYGNDGTTQNVNFQHSPQLHQQYNPQLVNSNMQHPPTIYQPAMPNGSFVASEAMVFHNPPPFGSEPGEMIQARPFNTSLSQMPQEYRSCNANKQIAYPGQTTSNVAMVGQTPSTGLFNSGQGYYNPHLNNQQWTGGEYLAHPVPSVTRNVAASSTMPANQKSSHTSLHSPESFHRDAASHSHIVGPMPELIPSPVPHPAGLVQNKTDCPKQPPLSQVRDMTGVVGSIKVDGGLAQQSLPSQCLSKTNKLLEQSHQDPNLSALSASRSQNVIFMQSGQSTGLPASLPSQSDAASTISPGESGYDSADIVHGSEESNLQQVPYYSSGENKEQDAVSKGLSGPKNLYRAPVGAKAGHNASRMCEHFDPQLKSDLPSAGAFQSGKATKNESGIFHCKQSTRRFSYDSCVDVENVQSLNIKIRRYSLPEKEDGQDTRTTSRTVSSLKSPTIKKSSESWNEGPVSKANLASPDGYGQTSFKGTLIGQRKIAPFDTPPLTPRSGDFACRQPTFDAPFENGSIGSKIGDILPTPPHMGETNLSKPLESVSHRGFKSQSENSSPSKTQFAPCSCIAGTDGRTDEAPYYTHLGAAESIAGIRRLFEKRTGYSGNAVRIEKVIYTGKEGKTSRGCPMAKWIIRRSGEHEKVLVVCRQRPGHHCATAVIVVIILLWDGVARPLADFAYDNFTNYVPKHGEPTERRCATNDDRTCACQGFDESTCGASFSFGCSWSMYYNGCKYARSNNPNKYKLTGTKDPDAEKFIGMLCEKLATVMSPLYEMAAPDAFHNQVEFEEDGYECRLGEDTKKNSRPFSGVTSCLDFCAHSHKDQHNMDNGSTVVVTFTKQELRTIGGKHSDEQLHVLPLCRLDISNEQGTLDGVEEKIKSGCLEILQNYRHEVRLRSKPKLSKKQKSRAKKKTDGNESPLCKRRGRPPKRASSVENLLDEFDAKDARSAGVESQWQSFTPNRCQMQSGMPLTSYPSGPQGIPPHPQTGFPGPLSPTRWPYKRPVPPHGLGSFVPNPQQPHQTPPPSDSSSLLDNLPSIGNFFRPGAGGSCQRDASPAPSELSKGSPASLASCPQVPNMKSPNISSPGLPIKVESPLSWNSSALPNSAPQLPAGFTSPPRITPLPSIHDVVMHPFHQNFAAVANNPSEAKANVQTPQRNDHVIEADPSTPTGSRIVHAMLPNQCLPDLNSYLDPRSADHLMQAEQTIIYSDSEENFRDPEIGGVAVAPGHGSVLIECAKKELHATTSLQRPNRLHPSRISLVFYQHKNMNARDHGAAQYFAKEEERRKQREEKRLEEMLKPQENLVSGMGSPLSAGMQSPFSQDRGMSGHYPTIGFQSPVQMRDQITHELDPNFPTHRSVLGSHHSHVPLPHTNHGDAMTPRQLLAKQLGSNERSLPFWSTDFGVAPPAMQSTFVSEENVHIQSRGWPRSIFPPGYRYPSSHTQNVNQMYVRQNSTAGHRPPSLSPLTQSPVSPMSSHNGIQSSPQVAISPRPMRFHQPQSPPVYAPHVRQPVYGLPSQHYSYPHHLQAGMYRPRGTLAGEMTYPQTNSQLTIVSNPVRAPITPH